jgi:isopentenyl-diphosphate delta-isomerase
MFRAPNSYQAKLAAAFVDWGIPTADAILNVRRATPQMIVFASGGIRDGIDIAKSIALGATLGGMASPFLKAATDSLEATVETIRLVQRQIQICMFASGVQNLEQLQQIELLKD